MILNALDEILFWDNIPLLKNFIKENTEKYYPNDYEKYYVEKNKFIRENIPDKSAFVKKLQNYSVHGEAKWVSGRNGMCDDIGAEQMTKAITYSSKAKNAEQRALKASEWQNTAPNFWQYYSDNVLHNRGNRILELTIGAGGGTNAIMRNMAGDDYYMGADIDFVCAKNADALAKYYKINGLGIAASLWNLPFEDGMFTSVCTNAGLEECREIPAILTEAVRVLAPKGRIIVRCLQKEKTLWWEYFESYGFTARETAEWLEKVRLFSGAEQVKELLKSHGLAQAGQLDDERLGHIVVFEK